MNKPNQNGNAEGDDSDTNSTGDENPLEEKYRKRMLNNVPGGYVSDSSADDENESETETFRKWVSNKRNADGSLKMVKKPKDGHDVQWNECVYRLKSYNRSKEWFDKKERRMLEKQQLQQKAKDDAELVDVTEQFEMDVEPEVDEILQFHMDMDVEVEDYYEHWVDVNDFNFIEPPSTPEQEEEDGTEEENQ